MRKTGICNKRLIMLLAIIVQLLAATAFPADFSYLSAPELKAILSKAPPELHLIDVRPTRQFEVSHIPGAVSLPLNVMDENPATPATPKDATLVFYCSGNT